MQQELPQKWINIDNYVLQKFISPKKEAETNSTCVEADGMHK